MNSESPSKANRAIRAADEFQQRHRWLALVIGLVGTFIGARSVATAIQNALNTVWEIPIARRPGFPWSWLRSFGLILVIGLGLIGTTVLSSIAAGAGSVLTGAGSEPSSAG